MSKRNPLPCVKRHIMINDEDWEWLEANFGRHTANPIGPGAAIRTIVHSKVQALRAKVIERLDAISHRESDIDAEIGTRIVQTLPGRSNSGVPE